MNRYRLTDRHAGPQDEIEVNLTPMLDVVFILLIFFIITASIVQETAIDIALAPSQSATQQSESIRVGIDRHGDIRFENQTIDPRTLQRVLAQMHSENPHCTVTILADKASDNAALISVLERIRRAGIVNIAIAAELDE